MAEAERIAVIGEWDSVLGFRALGLDTYPVKDAAEAKERIRELTKEACAVICLTETLANELEETLAAYKDALRPAVLLIPGREGSLGIGKRAVRQAVERAVGTDIL